MSSIHTKENPTITSTVISLNRIIIGIINPKESIECTVISFMITSVNTWKRKEEGEGSHSFMSDFTKDKYIGVTCLRRFPMSNIF